MIKQSSKLPSRAKKDGKKLAYNARRYHVRCGYRSRHS